MPGGSDRGQRQGSPQVLMPGSLTYLQIRMNIKEIDGAYLSHGHADHVANVPMLMQREQLKGDVYVLPGYERARSGAFGNVWDQLREPSFTQYGKGPGWQPTVLQVQQIPGPAGASVTRASFRIAGAS